MKKKVKTKGIKKDKQEDLKNQLARALADYDNLRKRIEREKGEFEKIANMKFAVKALSVFDMLEDAQKHLKDSGIALTLEELEKIFLEEGIEKIKAEVEDKFDEELHEAIEVVSGGKDGRISDIVLTGWKFMDGFVIRPTKVKVGKKGK